MTKPCFPCICTLPVPKYRKVDIHEVIKKGVEFFGYTLDDLIEKDRTLEPVAARFAVWKYLIEMGYYSLSDIGRAFNRHHVAVKACLSAYPKFLNRFSMYQKESIAFVKYMDQFFKQSLHQHPQINSKQSFIRA